jgi:3-isopropylmalate dehydrogenase
VNKSLEQGIVTEDLAAKGATAYKTSDGTVANL